MVPLERGMSVKGEPRGGGSGCSSNRNHIAQNGKTSPRQVSSQRPSPPCSPRLPGRNTPLPNFRNPSQLCDLVGAFNLPRPFERTSQGKIEDISLLKLAIIQNNMLLIANSNTPPFRKNITRYPRKIPTKNTDIKLFYRIIIDKTAPSTTLTAKGRGVAQPLGRRP